MLRWFPRFQVATTCFSCSPPDLNSVVTDFMFCIHVKQPRPPDNNPVAVNKYCYYYYYYYYYNTTVVYFDRPCLKFASGRAVLNPARRTQLLKSAVSIVVVYFFIYQLPRVLKRNVNNCKSCRASGLETNIIDSHTKKIKDCSGNDEWTCYPSRGVSFRRGLKEGTWCGSATVRVRNYCGRVLRARDDTIRKNSFFDTDARFRWQLDSCQSFLRHVSLQKTHTLSSNAATRGQYIKRLAWRHQATT